MFRKLMLFLHIVGTIMYLGTILAHIASGVMAGGNVEAVYYASIFKEQTAYIFIIPGIIIKTVSGLMLFRTYRVKPVWLKVKMGFAAFLAFNAFFLLTPLMPEIRVLAEESLRQGVLTEAYKEKEHLAMLVGMSNVIPIFVVIVLGVFKPKRKIKTVSQLA